MTVESLVVRALGTCAPAADPPPLARRLLVITSGIALMSYGRRRSVFSRLIAGAGAALATRALAGCDDLATFGAWIGRSRRAGERYVESRHETPSQQEVDDTVEQSFPASDPPSWPAAVASSVTKR